MLAEDTHSVARFKWSNWCNEFRMQLDGSPDWKPILDELGGIAEGAEVALDDIIVLNARQELAAWGRTCRDLDIAWEHTLWPIDDYHAYYSAHEPTLYRNILSEHVDTSTSAYFSDTVTNSLPIATHSWNMSATRTKGVPAPKKEGDFYLDSVTKIQHPVILLEIRPNRDLDDQNAISHFIVTKPGVLMMSGMNICGFSVVLDTIFSSLDRRLLPNDIPMVFIARKMLTCCTNVPMAIEMLQKLRYGSSRNLLLSQSGTLLEDGSYKEGAGVNIEVLPNPSKADDKSPLARHMGRHYLPDLRCALHTNHILSCDLLQNSKVIDGVRRPGVEIYPKIVNFHYRAADSHVRLARLKSLIREYMGPIDEEAVLRFFSDHHSAPESLCQHTKEDLFEDLSEVSGKLEKPWRRPLNNYTACFAAYHLNDRKITVSTGPPCEENTLVFHLKESPPSPPSPVGSVKSVFWEDGHQDSDPDVAHEKDEEKARKKTEENVAPKLGLDKKFKEPQKPIQIKPKKPETPKDPKDPEQPKKSNPDPRVTWQNVISRYILARVREQQRRRFRTARYMIELGRKMDIARQWEREQREYSESFPDQNQTEAVVETSDEEEKRRQEQEQRRLDTMRLVHQRQQVSDPNRLMMLHPNEIHGTLPDVTQEDRKLSRFTEVEEMEMESYHRGVRALYDYSAEARMGLEAMARWRLENGLKPRGSSLLRTEAAWDNYGATAAAVPEMGEHGDENNERAPIAEYDEKTGHRLFLRWGRPLREILPPRRLEWYHTQEAKLKKQRKRNPGLWQKRKKERRKFLEDEKKREEEEREKERRREEYYRKKREEEEEKKRKEEEEKKKPRPPPVPRRKSVKKNKRKGRKHRR
ncbi:hypothetical protein B0T21DRAFT_437343 [Apiosordaria backusii]|uniref:Uncharacterized protein n=1 Tax=Apiosordaria backusii TaxID=314023 RepID=A0AA40EIC1_9PEZI|nr:hypothetical protein B0T21DRAFT_437343 [Apiosordaria backusii]